MLSFRVRSLAALFASIPRLQPQRLPGPSSLQQRDLLNCGRGSMHSYPCWQLGDRSYRRPQHLPRWPLQHGRGSGGQRQRCLHGLPGRLLLRVHGQQRPHPVQSRLLLYRRNGASAILAVEQRVRQGMAATRLRRWLPAHISRLMRCPPAFAVFLCRTPHAQFALRAAHAQARRPALESCAPPAALRLQGLQHARPALLVRRPALAFPRLAHSFTIASSSARRAQCAGAAAVGPSTSEFAHLMCRCLCCPFSRSAGFICPSTTTATMTACAAGKLKRGQR